MRHYSSGDNAPEIPAALKRSLLPPSRPIHASAAQQYFSLASNFPYKVVAQFYAGLYLFWCSNQQIHRKRRIRGHQNFYGFLFASLSERHNDQHIHVRVFGWPAVRVRAEQNDLVRLKLFGNLMCKRGNCSSGYLCHGNSYYKRVSHEN